MIPEQLRDAILANNVVFFVGSGLSVGCGIPSWADMVSCFLNENERYVKNAQLYKANLEAGVMSPLEILDRLENVNKKEIYDYFYNIISKSVVRSDLHEAMAITSRRFVTTNYDKLIEHNIDGLRVVTRDSDYGLSKLDVEDSYILKLHGDVDCMDSCVVFTSQYKDMYSGDNNAIFQLKKIFSRFTVVFVGFSLKDKFVRDVFDYVGRVVGGFGPHHYMVSTGDHLVARGMGSISLDNHNDLGRLLEEMGRVRSAGKKVAFGGGVLLEGARILPGDGSDMPPSIPLWVGRDVELDVLRQGPFKVFFITGFGGEGKSSLAAQYLNEQRACDDFIVAWKDFKEEGHKFQCKMVSMIVAVGRDVDAVSLAGLTDDELVDVFFKELGKKRGVFVIDNVDSYIDYEELVPVNGIGFLFKAALAREHNAKFIFTCRPMINHASLGFHQLPLRGLTESDVIEYFASTQLPMSDDKKNVYARRAYSLTKGHALWVSLIIAQARGGEDRLCRFLEVIETGEGIGSTDTYRLAGDLLGGIWGSLKDREKVVLRALAEAVKAEAKDEFAGIVSSELNYKNFTKALGTLVDLNLVVAKKDSSYIELHPLVREFVRKKYHVSERSKYITLFIKHYGKYIVVLKKKLNFRLALSDFEAFTKSAELYINSCDFQNAISVLRDVCSAMSAAGYAEEFLRVSKMFFKSVPWTRSSISGLNGFVSLFSNTVKLAVELGEDSIASDLMCRFESLIESKEPVYIELCELRAYIYWFKQDFEKSMQTYEEAAYLLRKGNQPENGELKNNYALALRDTRNYDSIQKAIDIFAENMNIEDMFSSEGVSEDIGGPAYGNVGRCLFFMGKYSEALNCYCKSFFNVFTGSDSNRMINLGYASLWVAQCFEVSGDIRDMVNFAAYAIICWESGSPVLINRNKELYNMLARSEFDVDLKKDKWRIEQYCCELISRRIHCGQMC